MKALSIRQPWAWLILHAGKDVENRIWPTQLRGPVLLHASAQMTRRDYEAAQDFCTLELPESVVLPAFSTFARGGIVGQMEIVDCVTRSDSPWFTGPFGFVLANVRAVNFIPCKGALKFFQPLCPPNLRAEFRAGLELLCP